MTNISPSLIKYLHYLNPAILSLTFVNFAVKTANVIASRHLYWPGQCPYNVLYIQSNPILLHDSVTLMGTLIIIIIILLLNGSDCLFSAATWGVHITRLKIITKLSLAIVRNVISPTLCFQPLLQHVSMHLIHTTY